MSRAVLITGISGGIGSALGVAYLEAGYYVIGTGRSASTGSQCDQYLQADLNALACDTAILEKFRLSVIDALNGRTLDVLINNAASQNLAPLESLTIEAWQTSMNTNLTAPFLLAKILLPELERSGGNILNIGSVHALATKPEFVAYSTSKAALHGLTRALAIDLGGRVRVNCLAPAAISTPMLNAGFENNRSALKQLEACHPVNRIGTPEECAKVALFLTSDHAGFATGSVFYLDGGILSRLHDPV
ncbi:MAG: SDR family NAD(P)-dependent oxidoreductase [Maricaulis sp.]|nr:SDR family NAD(P)-dependent oxidoreductase [Maricaulis sp.]